MLFNWGIGFFDRDWFLYNEDGDAIALTEDAPVEYKAKWNEYKAEHDEFFSPVRGSYYMEIPGKIRETIAVEQARHR